jgi:hypothetical protein
MLPLRAQNPWIWHADMSLELSLSGNFRSSDNQLINMAKAAQVIVLALLAALLLNVVVASTIEE